MQTSLDESQNICKIIILHQDWTQIKHIHLYNCKITDDSIDTLLSILVAQTHISMARRKLIDRFSSFKDTQERMEVAK